MPEESPSRRCIRGAEILRDASRAAPERLDIWIESGRIAALTAPDAPPHFPGHVQTVDARGMLGIPGLINAHSHSYSALLRGTVSGEPLDLFVIRAMANRATRSSRAVYVSATLHAAEMLRRGITAQVDHLRHGALPTEEAVEAALRAYRDIGIRAAVAPMYEDRNYLDSLPIDQAALPAEVRERWRSATRPPPEEYFALLSALLPRWRGAAGRLDLLIGVDGPQRCTRHLLELTGEFAARHEIGLHTHLLEAKTQHLMAPPECGGSFVRYLDQFGLIGRRSSMAHFVWCTTEDIALAAERGVNVVHNPVSNLLLGSGIQPAARLLREGVSVALGSDGQSGAAMSVLEQAKFASLLSRVCDTDPDRWLDARAVFRLATEGGARVLGLPDELGVIAPGARADISLIDARGIDWRPRGGVFNHLVMYENGSNVRAVLVEGEEVVREGRCVRVDESELLREAEAISAELARQNEPRLAEIEKERRIFRELLLRALDRPVEANRFAALR